MQSTRSQAMLLPMIIVLSLGATLLSALAFVGWLKYGSAILLSAGETALSWCF